jgi:hypothetical protein
VQELSGIAKNRQRSLAALGALTFGHVAKLPSMLLKQKFGIWGQQLWLFSNGQWNEPLVLEIKDRTTISSSTTLPQDEHDYEAALTFMLSESTRLTGQLRREQMQAREFSVAVRFTNFTEVGTSHRFKHPQFLNSVINEVMEQMFRGIMAGQRLPVRQIRIAMFNLEKLDTHPTLWGRTHEERWGAVDDVAQKLNEQLGKTALMTGAQFALRHIDESQKQPKAKCPFTPQREMIAKLWGADGPAKPMSLHPNFPTSPYAPLIPEQRWFPADETMRATAYEKLIPPLVAKVRRRFSPGEPRATPAHRQLPSPCSVVV